MTQAQLFGQQVQVLRVCPQVRIGPLQVLAHALKGLHMALTRHEGALAGLLPSGLLQQPLPQRLQAIARAGRQRQARARRAGCDGIGLVPHVEHTHTGRQAIGQCRGNFGVGAVVIGLAHTGQVVQEQHRIGVFNLAPGPGHANLFHLVHAIALAQARGVDHVQGHAFDLNGLLHHIAGGARHRRDNRELCPRQRIEQ